MLPVGCPSGKVHCWLAVAAAQSQICTWVPDPPEPVSSRHLPDWGLSSSPLDCGCQTCAPVPLQVYRSTRVPFAVPPALTSRHLPSTCRVLSDATVHCWALVPLQVYTWIGLKSAVLAERSSRHRPWYPVTGPVGGVAACAWWATAIPRPNMRVTAARTARSR